MSDEKEKMKEQLAKQKVKEVVDEDIKNRFDSIRELKQAKNLSLATEELVKLIQEKEHIENLYGKNNEQLWIYIDGVWKDMGDIYIREYVRQCFKPEFYPRFYNTVLEKLKADSFVERTKFFDQEDKDGICLKNGIYDFEKDELVDHTPERIHFQKLDWRYDENADIDKIDDFLDDILYDESDKKVIQEMVGHVLSKRYDIEKMFMLNGAGSNGKSTLINLIWELLGTDNATNIDLQDLTGERFMKYQLFRRLANLGSEIDDTDLNNTSILKRLTGDYITADRKHKSMIRFQNYATLIFACNKLPRTFDDTNAFYRRWILLDFPYTFKKGKEYEECKDDDFVKEMNPNKIDDLTSDEEMRGFLSWGVEGARRLRRNGSFSSSRTTKSTRRLWKMKSDSFRAFASNCLVETRKPIRLKRDEMLKMYQRFCDLNDVDMVSKRNIDRVMRDTFGTDKTRTTTSKLQGGRENIVYYSHVRFAFDDRDLGYDDYSECDNLREVLDSDLYNKHVTVDEVYEELDLGDDGDGDVEDDVVDGVSDDMSYGVKKKNLENYLSRNGGKASIESLIEFGFGEDFIDKLLREGDLMENPSGYVSLL